MKPRRWFRFGLRTLFVLLTLTACAAWFAAKGARSITFDTIKFEMKKGGPFKRSMLTPEINKLDGKSIRISGRILPSFQQSRITQFVLVRDFGPDAALCDCIVVDMVGDAVAEYKPYSVSVEGVFTIREVVFGSKHSGDLSS